MARTPKPKTAAEIKEAKGNLKTLLKKLEADRKELDKGHKANVAEAQAPVAEAQKAFDVARKTLDKAIKAAEKLEAGLTKKYEKAVAASDKGLEKVTLQLLELDAAAPL